MKCLLLIIHLFIADTTTLNRDNLLNQLQQQEIKYPNIAFAQALLESNSFKSKLCKRYNNIFGMSYPVKRVTIAKRHHRYAKYNTWCESVQDYKLFQEYIFRNKELDSIQYLRYICKYYAKDKKYKVKLKRIMTITAEEARNRTLSDSVKEINKKLTALDVKIQARLNSSSKLKAVNIEIKDSILQEFTDKVLELGYGISKVVDSKYNSEIKVLTINW